VRHRPKDGQRIGEQVMEAKGRLQSDAQQADEKCTKYIDARKVFLMFLSKER